MHGYWLHYKCKYYQRMQFCHGDNNFGKEFCTSSRVHSSQHSCLWHLCYKFCIHLCLSKTLSQNCPHGEIRETPIHCILYFMYENFNLRLIFKEVLCNNAQLRNWCFVSKIVLTYSEKKFFQIATISLVEQFIQTVKGQYNF